MASMVHAELVAAISCGSTDALGALYDALAPVLLAAAHRILDDVIQAEDLVHDVFLEAQRRAWTYRPERGTVRTWLLVMLRSRALDRLRAPVHSRRDAMSADVLSTLSDPSQDPSGAPDQHAVRQRVYTLREEHRDVIELAYFGGLSATAIAKELDIPVGTAKSRMAAALRELRSELSVSPAGP